MTTDDAGKPISDERDPCGSCGHAAALHESQEYDPPLWCCVAGCDCKEYREAEPDFDRGETD